MDILQRIKRLVALGRYKATIKAEEELVADGLQVQDAVEAILSARDIKKVLRSTSIWRSRADEKLYVIEGVNFTGTLIYTKGAIKREEAGEVFYVLISSKISTPEY